MSTPDAPLDHVALEGVVELFKASAQMSDQLGAMIKTLHELIQLERRERDEQVSELRDELHTIWAEVAMLDRRTRLLNDDVKRLS